MPMRLGVIGDHETWELLRQGLLQSERRLAINTPFGEAQAVYLVASSKGSYYFLPRRGEEGSRFAPSAINYRANTYALKELGVQAIVAWGGAAALSGGLSVGRFALPDDVIDLTRGREATFFQASRRGEIPQVPVFCGELRQILNRALGALGLDAAVGGAYVCTDGPRLETAAEARLYAAWGGTLLGMTLCPEVFLARELAMCYAPVCYVTRHAGDLGQREYVSGALYTGLAGAGKLADVEAAVRRFPELVEAVLAALPVSADAWTCRRDLMLERHPDLADDWHDWLRE